MSKFRMFPYFKDCQSEKLYPNPYLSDWKERLTIDDEQHWRERWNDPQGVGMAAVLGVSQDDATLEVKSECGWAIVYEEPVDPLSEHYQRLEERQRYFELTEDLPICKETYLELWSLASDQRQMAYLD